MSGDIGLKFQNGYCDLTIARGDIAQDEGLETALLISLFTDARVDVEELPVGTVDRRGWWGDLLADDPNDKIGSMLWLLSREKRVNSTLIAYQDYAMQALQWLVEDGVAQSVAVVASYPRPDFVQLDVSVTKPQGKATFKYSFNWKAEGAKR